MCVDVDDEHPDCAVMQYEVDRDQRARCAGKVNTAQIARSKSRNVKLCFDAEYYDSVCVLIGRDGVWIELTYTGGDNYTSHCDKRARMTRLAFLCDPNINGKVLSYYNVYGNVLPASLIMHAL